MMAADPDLSEAGRARAASLAAMLKDAGVSAIFVTEFKRTQQTAAPLAKALGITPTVVPAKDTAGLAARLKKATGNVLVVGHSNTVPEVITAIGVAKPVSVADTEFDNLFIVHTSCLWRGPSSFTTAKTFAGAAARESRYNHARGRHETSAIRSTR